MKRIGLLIFIALSCSSCMTPAVVKGTGETWVSKVNKVVITEIDFYDDKNFSQPAKPSWYMDDLREGLKTIAKRKLSNYGFELTEGSDTEKELRVQMDVCVLPGLIVSFYCRARVYYKDALLCEIFGNCTSMPTKEEVIKNQEKLADKLIAVFAEKIQYKNK